ncbi:MAG: hypothetical protein V1807_03085 [Patescibacteria group bacterium]
MRIIAGHIDKGTPISSEQVETLKKMTLLFEEPIKAVMPDNDLLQLQTGTDDDQGYLWSDE